MLKTFSIFDQVSSFSVPSNGENIYLPKIADDITAIKYKAKIPIIVFILIYLE